MLKNLITRIIVGVIEGIIFYLVFVYAIPFLIKWAVVVPSEILDPMFLSLLLAMFISLGIISSSVKPCIGIIFSALSFMLGLLIVVEAVGVGVMEVQLIMYDASITATFEFKPLLLLILGFSIILFIIRAFGRIIHGEK